VIEDELAKLDRAVKVLGWSVAVLSVVVALYTVTVAAVLIHRATT
jgi:hypothetical protein